MFRIEFSGWYNPAGCDLTGYTTADFAARVGIDLDATYTTREEAERACNLLGSEWSSDRYGVYPLFDVAE